MNAEPSKPLLKRLLHRVFPPAIDFYALMNEQAAGVVAACEDLVEFMEFPSPEIARRLLDQEHKSDDIKVRNLQLLSDAFSTPIDREDLYRAIMSLDEVVNYCKTTIKEMDVLGVTPGKHELDMAMRLKEGVQAIRDGFGRLPKLLSEATEQCRVARKAERAVERCYRQALSELFQGTDYINMFKRREVYRHLSNTADRMATCAGILNDIAVKMG